MYRYLLDVTAVYTEGLSPTIFSLSLVRQFAPFLVRLGPAWMRRRLVEWTPNAAVQKVKGMSDVMHAAAVEILVDARAGLERADAGIGARAKDIISLLRELHFPDHLSVTHDSAVRANETVATGDQLSEAELTGQMTCVSFWTAMVSLADVQ